jgi:protein-tyrosine phosphatase
MGNICRSPTAEGVMRELARRDGVTGLELDSAGTGGWHVGEPPDPRSIAAAARRGYTIDGHRARQFVAADFDRFDLVVVMDRDNLAIVRKLAELRRGDGELPAIRMLRAFDPESPKGAEVPDPYSGGAAGFDEVIDICERACRGLLDHLRSTG